MAMLNPAHPGEVIREDVLEELGLSVKDAAERLGVSRVALSRVVNGRARINPELALRLEDTGSAFDRPCSGAVAVEVLV
ncbi:HigA family addiction module antitoxin [Nesterenkonia ebinurensis]|uniref:HigA family addiction module antitoxin n=1 Tax=Nesterenkonia ebinurensis TaxID=2608252 RepID=UPI001CC5519C|nr:HigA family addiction module antitoxin [Nesterenkonia ebinurensis]